VSGEAKEEKKGFLDGMKRGKTFSKMKIETGWVEPVEVLRIHSLFHTNVSSPVDCFILVTEKYSPGANSRGGGWEGIIKQD
jgi:hypothetical protein